MLEHLEQMRDLRELQRIIEDFEQGFVNARDAGRASGWLESIC